MGPEVFLDADGTPVFICGYAGVFDRPRADGHPEIVRPGAFDHVLKHPRAGFNLQFHHGGPAFMAGCLALDTLWVWSDDFGLGFQAGPFTACGRNGFLLRSIANGEIRGASWSGTLGSGRFENCNGEQTRVIRRLKTLDHIAVVAEGAYPEAGCWLSSEYYYDMPRRLQALAEIWSANRRAYDTARAFRKMTRVTARLPRRAPGSRVAPSRPQAKAPARRPASLPLSVREIYPAIPGISSAELAKLAFQESKYWRMFKSNNPGISRAKARGAKRVGAGRVA